MTHFDGEKIAKKTSLRNNEYYSTQEIFWKILRYLRDNPVKSQTAEYNDNRISLYSGQLGLCAITKLPLEIEEMEVHHKKPRSKGGTDEYKNLIYVNTYVHRLIHCTSENTEKRLMEKLKLTSEMIKKVNSLRKLCGSKKLGEVKAIIWGNAVCGESRMHGVERGKIWR